MLADLAVDEAVGDELEHLDLAGRGILTHFPRRGRCKGDDGAVPPRAATRRSSLESAAVVAIAVQNLLALGSIHVSDIGNPAYPL